jgi:AcrR family transcriptional regulator
MNTVMNMVATTVANRRPARVDLRRRIEAAALELWRAHGFDAVSVDAIVQRAGVSKGAFFIFFPTKADALRLYADQLAARLESARARLDGSKPLTSLDAFAMEAEAVLEAEGALARAAWRELAGRAAAALVERDRNALTAVAADAQAAGGFDPDADPALAGAVLADLWTAVLLAWAAGELTGGLAETARGRFRLLACGLMAT